MTKAYIEDYYGLLDILKDKLTSNDIDKKYVEIYLSYLNMIDETINSNSTQKEYEVATDKLFCILEELKQLNHTNIDNYKIVDVKRPIPKQNEEASIQAFVDEVTTNLDATLSRMEKQSDEYAKAIRTKITQINNNIKHIKGTITEKRVKVIANLLMLSVLIGAPIHMFFEIKKKTNYRVVYPTIETIYDTRKQQENLDFYLGMPVVSNTLSYNMEELEFSNVSDNAYVYGEDGYHYCYYVIKEKEPWEKIGREAVRMVRSCVVPVNDIGNMINLSDFNSLYNTYDGTETKEIVFVSDIPRSDRQFYSQEENANKKVYEIIKYDQNLNEPKNVVIANDYTSLYLFLAAEALIWFGVVEIKEGLLIEGIINNLWIISQNKHLIKAERDKARKLYNEYLKIYNQTTKKVKKKRKNK